MILSEKEACTQKPVQLSVGLGSGSTLVAVGSTRVSVAVGGTGVSDGTSVSVMVGVKLGFNVSVAVPVGVPVHVLNGVNVCEGVQEGEGVTPVGVGDRKGVSVVVGSVVGTWVVLISVSTAGSRVGVGCLPGRGRRETHNTLSPRQ